MIATIASILGVVLVGSLATWATLAIRHRIRVAREEGREEIRRDICDFIAKFAEGKRADGDTITARALESAGRYIWNRMTDDVTEALRNQARERELREKEQLAS